MSKYHVNASFFKRLAAFYLAFFIITLASLCITIGLHYSGYISSDYFSLNFLFSVLTIFGLVSFSDAFLQCFFTANVAKAIMGIKILDVKREKPLTIIKALIRALTSYISIGFFGLGFVAIAFNKDHSSLHDYLANSKVVEIKRSGIAKIVTNIIAVLSILLGLVVTGVVIVALLFTLNYSIKTMQDSRKYLLYSQEVFVDNIKPIVLPLNHSRLAALTEFHTFAEFIEYQLDPLANVSTIQEEKLKLLGLNNFDFYYELKILSQNPLQVKLQKSIIMPKLIFKNIEGKDFLIENHKFIIAQKSVLANDLLSMFDYKINESSIELGLYQEDAKIINDPNFDQSSKAYLLNFLRQVRMAWREALRYAPVALLEELANTESQNELVQNQIQVTINNSGDFEKITLLEPSKHEFFNKFCEEFMSGLPHLRFMPSELSQKAPLTLELNLTYNEKI